MAPVLPIFEREMVFFGSFLFRLVLFRHLFYSVVSFAEATVALEYTIGLAVLLPIEYIIAQYGS